jgi:4-amino-4-deoxy-L-arabinose transferase-like glycosyltransferase
MHIAPTRAMRLLPGALDWPITRSLPMLAAGLLLLVLCVPVFSAERSPINSDQSLYLAEALNIAEGKGATYPTGQPITHRAPLYPALLAGVFRIEGVSLDAAYLVPRLSVVANVLLLFLLGRALFGTWGGIVAGVTAASSLYLRGLGTTLFLDSTQMTLLLAALLLYWRAARMESPFLMAASGGLLGASLLIKEASLLFLPLPVVVVLLYGGSAGWKPKLVAWFGGFGAVTVWWWVWVFVHTGDLFLVGSPNAGSGLAVMGATVASGFAFLVALRLAPSRFAASGTSRLGAVLILLAWNALFLAGLDATAWQYDSNYLANVPAYLDRIFLPNVQPAPLILAAWAWVLFMAAKGKMEAGVIVVALLLYASFFLMVADRGLSLRDQLPVVYLSYLALGGAAAWLVKSIAAIDFGRAVRSLGGAGAVTVVVALAGIAALSGTSLLQARAVALQDDWENPLARQTAAWIDENVDPGASILSSRLYYSQLYFLTRGAYPVHQLPTVEVELDTEPGTAVPLRRRSTLFRWENHVMPADVPGEAWLYLTRYPEKGYFVAMAEDDLLAELRSSETAYVIVSSLDAGFSSPSFNRYFEANPGFELVHVISATSADEVRIYRVDRGQLAPHKVPAEVTRQTYEYLVAALGGTAKATDYLDRLNLNGFEVTQR